MYSHFEYRKKQLLRDPNGSRPSPLTHWALDPMRSHLGCLPKDSEFGYGAP